MFSAPELKDYLSPAGTLLAAIIGIFGSWIAFVRDPRRVKSLEFRLKYVEEQLAQLYGPLLGVLKEAEAAYATIRLALGLTSISPHDLFDVPGASDPEQQKFLAALWERYILTYYERALSTIAHHHHLLGPAPPSSLPEFVKYAGESRVRYEVLISGSYHARKSLPEIRGIHKGWPAFLVAEVEAKISALTELQREYRARLEGDRIGRRLRRNRFEVKVDGKWHGPYMWVELQTFTNLARRGEISMLNIGTDPNLRIAELLVRESDHPNVERIIAYGSRIMLSELEDRIRVDES